MLVRSAADGPVVARRRDGSPALADDQVREATRSPASRRTRPRHLRRTDGFAHVPDILVNSFYDPVTEEGCAFEELISFHGGMGGPQTQAVHPSTRRTCPRPTEPLVGAEAVHRVLRRWRAVCNGGTERLATPDRA